MYETQEQMTKIAAFGRIMGRLFGGVMRQKPGFVIVPVVILGIFIILAISAPWISPHDPEQISLRDRYTPPVWDSEGSWDYPLGTDAMGRDVLSRMIYGARVSLSFAFLGVLAAASFGTLLGLIAGYYGRWVDAVIGRLVDLTMSLPLILIAMTIVVVWGAGFVNMIVIVAVLMWCTYARMARGETLSVKERDFVALAKISGVSGRRIIIRHIFPNVVNSLMVLATFSIAGIILLEASMSFLGVGIPPPKPTWGTMVADGRGVLDQAWWVSTFPGIAIGLVVLSFNLLGDWLRDKLDPRLRQV